MNAPKWIGVAMAAHVGLVVVLETLLGVDQPLVENSAMRCRCSQ